MALPLGKGARIWMNTEFKRKKQFYKVCPWLPRQTKGEMCNFPQVISRFYNVWAGNESPWSHYCLHKTKIGHGEKVMISCSSVEHLNKLIDLSGNFLDKFLLAVFLAEIKIVQLWSILFLCVCWVGGCLGGGSNRQAGAGEHKSEVRGEIFYLCVYISFPLNTAVLPWSMSSELQSHFRKWDTFYNVLSLSVWLCIFYHCCVCSNLLDVKS